MTTSVLLLISLLAQSQNYLADGMKALDAKQPAVAESLLRKAVEADPTDLNASFNLALVLGMEGKDTEAIATYRKTLELNPKLYEADLNLGILLLRNKQPAEAAIVLKEAVDLKPTEYRPRFFYAQASYDSIDFVKAEQLFREAAAMDPKSAAASLGIARSLLKQGKLSDAAPWFRTAASLDPAFRNALLELGSEYDKAGQNEEAIAIYREFPNNAAATKRLTDLLVETNNALAAIPEMERAVRTMPTTENRMALIDAYRQTNQRAKALAELQRAVTAVPSSFELHMAYGRTLRDDRKFPEAAHEFQAASKLQPESVPALNELAGVLILAGQLDDGLAALDRVRALGKEIPGDIYLRAITLDKLHRNKPALDAYRQFLAVSNGKSPDEEFLSRQRARIIEKELAK